MSLIENILGILLLVLVYPFVIGLFQIVFVSVASIPMLILQVTLPKLGGFILSKWEYRKQSRLPQRVDALAPSRSLK